MSSISSNITIKESVGRLVTKIALTITLILALFYINTQLLDKGNIIGRAGFALFFGALILMSLKSVFISMYTVNFAKDEISVRNFFTRRKYIKLDNTIKAGYNFYWSHIKITNSTGIVLSFPALIDDKNLFDILDKTIGVNLFKKGYNLPIKLKTGIQMYIRFMIFLPLFLMMTIYSLVHTNEPFGFTPLLTVLLGSFLIANVLPYEKFIIENDGVQKTTIFGSQYFKWEKVENVQIESNSLKMQFRNGSRIRIYESPPIPIYFLYNIVRDRIESNTNNKTHLSV